MTVAEAVGRALAAAGVRVVFGVAGSGNFVVTNALVAGGARYVAARHEGGATGMADGWGRWTGEVAAASVHQGPGLTNTLTHLAEAAKSRTALLVLAGETPAAATGSNFRIDQHDLVESVGAVAMRIHSAATAAGDAVRALERARLERRPVVLMLPIDLQAAEAPGGDAAPADAAPAGGAATAGDAAAAAHGAPAGGPGPADRADATVAGSRRVPAPPAPDPAAVEAVAALLRDARWPLIVAGRGALDAGPDLQALAECAGALVATSAVAHGLFAGDPACLGISGGFSTPLAAELLPTADVVLAVGASLNHWTTRHGALLGPGATIVGVDRDPAALGRHQPLDVAVVGDAGLTARALLDAATPAAGTWRTPQTLDRIAAAGWNAVPYEDAGDGTTIDPRTFSRELDARLPGDRVVVVDSGHFTGWPAMHLRVGAARDWLFVNGFQAVGLGLGVAVGAAVANPGRVTVCAAGDGGTFLALPELETAARLRLRLLVAVYDDEAYGAEVHHFGPQGHDTAIAEFGPADLAAIARGAGCAAQTVRSPADLDVLDAWLADGDGPLLLDAKVSPHVVADWLKEAFKAG